jgi:hypothetical protein
MSDKFFLLKETKIGTLDDSLLGEWERLCDEGEHIQALTDAHEEGLAAFWDAVSIRFGHHADIHNADPSFRVDEDGDIFLDFCQCPMCQARFHGLTVGETVEAMYRSDLIPREAIDHLRHKARVVDSARRMSKKLMN